ncbi:MAG: M28 family peptidase [Bryobacteraceae bacterium]|nr:M28 family peptidase [Bryobacteraceae bacterium]
MKICFCVFVLGVTLCNAQQPPSRLNPAISRIVQNISEPRIEATLRKLESFGTRYSMSPAIREAEKWIAGELRSYSPRLQVSTHAFTLKKSPRALRDVELNNVIAVLPGTVHKDRFVIVSAHYDTVAYINKPVEDLDARIAKAIGEGMSEAEARAYLPLTPQDEVRGAPDLEKMDDPAWKAPGVNDDGSGTAAVMELARVMSGYEFDKSIVFVAFAAEEMGLVGSTAYAKDAKDKKMLIEAVLNNDIIGNETAGNGRSASSRVRLFSAGPEDSLPRAVAVYAKEIGERYVPSMTVDLVLRQDRFRRGGDHTPFAKEGFGAVRFTTASENYAFQHTPNDTLANMSVPYNTRVARVNAAVAASLAMAPVAPQTTWNVSSGKTAGAKRGLLSRGKGGYDAVLRWIPVADADLAGYEVVMRSTANPLWEKSIYVGNVREYTLPDVSVDDLIFGVRAIDKDGNPSLVSSYGLDSTPSASSAPGQQ